MVDRLELGEELTEEPPVVPLEQRAGLAVVGDLGVSAAKYSPHSTYRDEQRTISAMTRGNVALRLVDEHAHGEDEVERTVAERQSRSRAPQRR